MAGYHRDEIRPLGVGFAQMKPRSLSPSLPSRAFQHAAPPPDSVFCATASPGTPPNLQLRLCGIVHVRPRTSGDPRDAAARPLQARRRGTLPDRRRAPGVQQRDGELRRGKRCYRGRKKRSGGRALEVLRLCREWETGEPGGRGARADAPRAGARTAHVRARSVPCPPLTKSSCGGTAPRPRA